MNDYIFCPLCGSTDWRVNKLKYTSDGRITRHECVECGKFTYSNVNRLISHPTFSAVTEVARYSETAYIGEYYISVFHSGPITNVRDNHLHLIFSVARPIQFNWYKQEEVLEKIKKYVLFS